MIKTFKIFLFFFIIQFLNNFLYANENPNNLPDCSNDINPNEWSNCYKYVGYGNNFEYSGTWKNGTFNGIGKIFDDLGNFEQGNFKEGIFNWQWEYNYEELNGVWNLEAGGEFSETIYFFENWIGFKSIDKVCKILATESPFIRNKNSKEFGIKNLSFKIFITNCKDNNFILSFDNIFIANKGAVVLFQMKVMEPNEEVNPILNPTFPEKYYPGLNISYYDSFERGDIGFYKINKTQGILTEEEFFNNFGHKFDNN